MQLPRLNWKLPSRSQTRLIVFPNGMIGRQRTHSTFEVWGIDISEHFLISVNPNGQPMIDCIFIQSQSSLSSSQNPLASLLGKR